MFLYAIFLFIPLLIPINGEENDEIFEKLSYQTVQDLSCLVGLCFVAEGCKGNPWWRRVLEWPKWDTAPTDCLHAFMIRKNLDPARNEKINKEIIDMLNKKGEEYYIVMASGGPNGPAREMRMETSQLKLIFTVTHDDMKGGDKRKFGNTWTLDSYDYQKVDSTKFEAGVLARIKNVPKKKEKGDSIVEIEELDLWEDFCIFIHGSQSMQHLCGGLERLFQRLPSKTLPMKLWECDGELPEDQFTVDAETGFFKCKVQKDPSDNEDIKPIDDVLEVKTDGMEYVKMHYAFCKAGKTQYLVEHHIGGFQALQYKTKIPRKCGGKANQPINGRCKVPDVPAEVKEYCGERCERGGMIMMKGEDGKETAYLTCSFLDTVIDGTSYGKQDLRKNEEIPKVYCDPTGWWRFLKPSNKGRDKKWIKDFYCFYPQSRLYSDCVLDRFSCGKYGECPKNRQHQVDCDENTEGLVLAVFHEGLENGYTQVKKLECDSKNRWWTVDGKSLPKTATVDCVWPFELEIKKRAAAILDWDPEPVEPRALSEIGPTVRTASMMVAGMAGIAMIVGVILVQTRLQGPKTRMLSRHLRSFYPSLLNEQERSDKSKAAIEYKSVDCEAAGLALHHLYKKVLEETKFTYEEIKELHKHWISLTWPNRNLLLERALLHRAFFGLKVLYDKFQLPEGECTLGGIRPGLREKILKASLQYKAFIEQWNSSELVFSLAFASLSNADLEAFRKNIVKKKILRLQPTKDNNKSTVQQLDTDAPELSKKTGGNDSTIPAENTAGAPTLDATATATGGVSTGKGATEKDKVEEVTAPPQE